MQIIFLHLESNPLWSCWAVIQHFFKYGYKWFVIYFLLHWSSIYVPMKVLQANCIIGASLSIGVYLPCIFIALDAYVISSHWSSCRCSSMVLNPVFLALQEIFVGKMGYKIELVVGMIEFNELKMMLSCVLGPMWRLFDFSRLLMWNVCCQIFCVSGKVFNYAQKSCYFSLFFWWFKFYSQLYFG